MYTEKETETEAILKDSRKPKGAKKKGKKKVILIAAALIALLAVGSFVLGFGGGATQSAVSTSTIERGKVSQTISLKGTIEGSDSAAVYSAASYKIKSIAVKTGDRVKEGQVLATLDADSLANEYDKAALALSEAKRKYDSSKSLYEAGAISKSDYLTAKADYESSSLALSALDVNENSNIISPISGTVTRVNATVGKPASGSGTDNEPLFMIENLDQLQMKVQVSEYDINDIKIGQTAEISSEVLGDDTVSGVVSHIAPTGEKKDASSSEMVIPVVISLNEGNSNLIAGVTAKAVILVEEKTDVLTVPIDAVLEDADSGESYIFTVSDSGILSKKAVTVGLYGNLNVEISGNGLKEGQRVLLSPTYEYTDGMQVTLSPEQY